MQDTENPLIEHANREFLAAGYKPIEDEDGPNRWMQEHVLALLRVFAEQGHSGASAPACVHIFSRLAAFKPLAPLTGADQEWVEVAHDLFQNNRCSHVFKDGKGRAWDINGRIFRDQTGCTYTNLGSHVPVTFPYTPKSEIIDVDADGNWLTKETA